MPEIIILKNKRLTIKVSLDEQDGSSNKLNDAKYNGVEIEKDGSIVKYEEVNGKAQIVDTNKSLEKSLSQLALDEKRLFYKNLLQHQYNEIENIVVLSGAGSSKGVGEKQKGLTTRELWDEIEKEKKDCLEILIKETEYTSGEKDLERLLSLAGMQQILHPTKDLDTAITEVKKIIVDRCSLKLPANSPHLHFLNKVLLRPQKFPRTKIFTLNYDTLFEQAAGDQKFTVIDGFTFSSLRIFNGKYFDYDIIETKHNRQDKKDSTIAKLFYLFKMHGSLNWKKNKITSEIEQYNEENIDVDKRVMIFPQDSKYEHSYEQPYFEMMARFQQALRTENTLLITIGFSFIDKHISSVILESMKQNASLNLMAFTYPEIIRFDEGAKGYQKELYKITSIQSRVTLVAETFEDLANNYPENIAHNRFDLLEQLNEGLKSLKANEDK